MSTYEFDEEFQRKVAALCLRDHQFNVRTDGLIAPGYFENAAQATLVDLAQRYYNHYKTVPSKVVLVKLIKDAIRRKAIRADMLDDIKAEIVKIFKTDVSDRDYVVDECASFARHQAIIAAMESSVDLLERREFDAIEQKMTQAMQVAANDASEGHDLFADIEARALRRKEVVAGTRNPAISSGFKKFDDATSDGGFTRGELSVIMGGAKRGKCVTRDTLVLSQDGMMEIGDYVPRSIAPDTFEPFTCNVLGRDGMEPASHVYNNGFGKIYRMRTQKGFVIEGTPNHPMLVAGETGELVWRNLEDIKTGDNLTIQRGRRIFGSSVDLVSAVEKTRAWIENHERRACVSEIRLPTRMTEDLAEFMGMIIAEGHLGADGLVSFTQKDRDILDRYLDLASDLFGIKIAVNERQGCFEARSYSRMLQVYLEALGVQWCKSSGKEIPRSIRTAPEPIFRRFLATVLGLEGSVVQSSPGRTEYHLSMASKNIMRQIHLALVNYGVVGALRRKIGSASNGSGIKREYWALKVSGQRNLAKLAEIGLYESRKITALETGLNGVVSTARDRIPYTAERVGLIMEEMKAFDVRFKRDVSPTLARQLRAVRSGKRHLSYGIAEQLVETCAKHGVKGPFINWLRKTLNDHYAFDPVVEIEESEAETVDFTVPGTHSFWANGLVSHNSFGLMNFAVNAAIKGHNVLFVTLENSTDVTTNRMDSFLSGVETKKLNDHIDAVADKVKKALEGRGVLKIHHYPTGTFSPRDLKRLIERYRAQGLIFDEVVIDYWDIMKPPVSYRDDSIRESAQIGVELRGIAIEENVAMITAVQTNRDGFKAAQAGAEHVAEDFNKVRLADLLFSINADDEERAEGKARIYFAAVRNTEGGYTIEIEQDLSKATFIKKVLGRAEAF